jgi:hypothetical protein
MEQFGAKDLYKVVIRATSNMKVGNRDIVAGEPLLYLDSAQFMAVAQQNAYVSARGGRHNMSHVIWERSGEVNFVIQRGVISPMGYALITNLNVLDLPEDGSTILTKTEILTVDDYGSVFLTEEPSSDEPIFIYGFKNKVIQGRIEPKEITGQEIKFEDEYQGQQVLVDYSYRYGAPAQEYRLDKNRLNGYLSMEARYYTKGESGMEYTNIIYLPKMKIISDLYLRVGENVAGPTLSTFNIVAATEVYNGENTIMRVLQLEEDVDRL